MLVDPVLLLTGFSIQTLFLQLPPFSSTIITVTAGATPRNYYRLVHSVIRQQPLKGTLVIIYLSPLPLVHLLVPVTLFHLYLCLYFVPSKPYG